MASERERPRDNPTITISDPNYGDKRTPIKLVEAEIRLNSYCTHKLDLFKANYTNIADPTTIQGTVYRVIAGVLTPIRTNPIKFSADGPDKVKGEWTFDIGNVPYDEPYILRVYVGATEDTTSFTVIKAP